jgi:FkbM family methyltransferase
VSVRLVRRLATTPGVRRLTRFPPLLRLSFALRATLVRERSRFVRNELRRRTVTAVYRLRGSGIAIAIRHHTGDVLVLDEIFSQREYEPPAPVRAALAGLPTAPRVVDLGANIGLFGAWLLERFPDAKIIAVEADPANASMHRQAIEANGLQDRWSLVEGFASSQTGVVRFVGGDHATSHAGGGEGSIDVRAVDVFPELAAADLVKIDIEGAEWDLLADPRFAALRPRVLVLEYHEDGCPGSDPVRVAEDALRAAGLDVVRGASKPQFGAGILWALPRTDSPSADESHGVAEDS